MSPELAAILAPLVAALAGALLGWIEKVAREAPEIHDAETPADLRGAWDRYLRDQLRDKDPPP